MSDIFLSYASEDVTRAGLLARALMRQGWSVWWDRSILPGKVFDTVIEAELSAAKCVIVLWSAPSVESRWVRAEAGEALDKGRLIPVLLDEVVIPLVFRQVQAASLIGWDGDDAHAGFQHLLKAITALVPPPAASSHHATGIPAQPAADSGDTAAQSGGRGAANGTGSQHRHTGWWAFAALSALLVAAAAAYILREDQATVVARNVEAERREVTPESIAAPPAPRPADTRRPAVPPPQAATAEAAPEPIAKPAAPVPLPAPVATKPPQRATPVVKAPEPVVAKPAGERRAPPATPAAETVAKAEPAPKPAATLSILTVVWAMPSDNGTASTASVQKYSASLSQMMTAVVKESLRRPVAFDYYYPSQREYYRLLKDTNDHASSRALCSSAKADLVISGFVKGAEFVSANFGYALTRNPLFSVFDCKTNKKITQTYQVAEHVDDSFPFEKATTTAFRKFATQDAALAKY